MMTRNRTAIDAFSAIGTELMVVLLLVLAMGLAVSQYFTLARDRVRRVEVKLRRRAARRTAL
jgi:type II secretory pathway pseudopilin PulG